MTLNMAQSKRFLGYFLLVFVLSTPFWLLGAQSDDAWRQAIPINLPISALMVVCPLIAAAILVYREQGSAGVKTLLRKALDYKRISDKRWYVPTLLLMPLITFASYALMRVVGMPLPEPHIPLLMIPVLFVPFLVAAVSEEAGWQGYAFEPMQARWGALRASLALGVVWALWHVIPYFQAQQAPAWILWQCLNLVALRVLIVWIYNNTGQSVFAASLAHAMSNVSVFLFPNFGSHYDPFVAFIVTCIIAFFIGFAWGPQTLTQNRFIQHRY